MNDTTTAAPERFFLDKFGLDGGSLERILGTALIGEVDDADLYFEYTTSETLSLEEGIVKSATHDVQQGAGVRVISGERTGHAHSDEISVPQLQGAARTAHAIARVGGPEHSVALSAAERPHDLYPVPNPAIDEAIESKIALLEAMDRAGRAYDPRITKVMASLAIEQKVVLIVRSDGRLVGDVRPLIRVSVQAIAEEYG